MTCLALLTQECERKEKNGYNIRPFPLSKSRQFVLSNPRHRSISFLVDVVGLWIWLGWLSSDLLNGVVSFKNI